MKHKVVALSFFVMVLIALPPARAENPRQIVKALGKQLVGKTFLLRNYEQGNTLRYASSGLLTSPADPGTWTLDGHVRIAQIKLTRHTMNLMGYRVFMEYLTSENQWVGMEGGPIQIIIPRPRGRLTLEEFNATMGKIFKNDSPSLVPSYWRDLNDWSMLPERPGQCRGAKPIGTLSGNAVWPSCVDIQLPKPGYKPSPQYTKQARMDRISGELELAAIFTREGLVADVTEVSDHLGGGLDASAIEKIRTWVFTPAVKDGSAVDVAVKVQVIYRLL